MSRFLILISVYLVFLDSQFSMSASEKNKKNNVSSIEKSALPSEDIAELSRSIAELIPFTVKSHNSSIAQNRDKILRNLGTLLRYAHDVKSQQKEAPEIEPIVKFITPLLKEDLVLSIALMKRGQYSAAQPLINSVTGQCVGCHSHKKSKFYYGTVNIPEGFQKFSSLEKAEYYAASKQFNEAIKYYESVLTDSTLAKIDSSTWSLAVKRLLAIVVRVKQNPSLALELISRFRDVKSLPKGFEATVGQWRLSTKEWRDKGRSQILSRSVQLSTAKNLLKEAENLALKKKNISDVDFVLKLRAANFLHEILAQKPLDKVYGEALLQAGLVTESLRNFNFWTTQSTYYEACIRFQPRTPTAQKCYSRFLINTREYLNTSTRNIKEYKHFWQLLAELKSLSGVP